MRPSITKTQIPINPAIVKIPVIIQNTLQMNIFHNGLQNPVYYSDTERSRNLKGLHGCVLLNRCGFVWVLLLALRTYYSHNYSALG